MTNIESETLFAILDVLREIKIKLGYIDQRIKNIEQKGGEQNAQ